MPYDPTNNPYIPGDPYSYDLKWVVEQLEYAISLYMPLSTDFQELHDYVMNYFDNLDLSQEVSDKIDEMVSDGTFADLLQIMFDAYEADIDRAIELQNEAITILENRMDTFASLPPGSTAGNAELLDIRVEYNGQIATSAGNAVRGQINELHSLYNTLLNAVFITDQASGPIASFPDGADNIPPKRAVFNIDPIQDLHGYSAPWPAGGNKNIFNKDGTDVSEGFVSGNYLGSGGAYITPADPDDWNISEYILVDANSDYTLSGLPTSDAAAPSICQYDSSKNYITGTAYNNNADVTITTDVSAAYVRISIPTVNADAVQLEAGSSATSYVPYANICPISGWTGANISGTGANLWDEDLSDCTPITALGGDPYYRTPYLRIAPNATYYLMNVIGTELVSETVTFYDANYTKLGSAVFPGTDATSGTFTTPSNCAYIHFRFNKNYLGSISLNYPSTDTSYHAGYFNDEYPVTWTSPAGTVYGGTISYIGDGQWRLKKMLEIADMGDLNWLYSNNYFYLNDMGSIIKLPASTSALPSILSSIYKPVSYDAGAAKVSDNMIFLAAATANYKYLYVYDTAYSDVPTFKTAVTGQQLVYELANPTYYTITGGPNLITLLGANNIFSDTGDADITYRADPTLYLAGH